MTFGNTRVIIKLDTSTEAKCEFSQLTIPNDNAHIQVAIAYVDEIARNFGFQDKDRADISIALSAAVKNIMENAFESHERTSLDISCERVTLGLKIVIRDMGMPLDSTQTSRQLLSSEMTSVMDVISVNNLGRGGKETVLVKYLGNQNIKEYFEACNLEPYSRVRAETVGVSVPLRFTVRQMKPEEAIEVSRAVYRAYGYSYAVPHVYYPERIIEINKSGQMYSVVAVTEDGDLAGHCAMFKWDPANRIAELGLAVVKPEYRSHGIFNLLTAHLIDKARSESLMGVFGQAVTNHTYSQQVGHKCGLRDCAIALAVVPETESFRGITERLIQRESLVVHFMYLNKPGSLTIFPPDRHKKMINRLYNNLEMDPEIETDLKKSFAQGQSVITTSAGGPKGFVRIEVERYGERVVSEVKSTLKDLCFKRIDVIHLVLDLSDPSTSIYVELFERLGFFFAGILPGGCAGDALILQYLNNVPMDYEQINVDSKLGRELLTYIKELDPNREFEK